MLEVDATVENVLPVKEAVISAAQDAGYSEMQLMRIEVVLEESFLNVVHHAYHDRGGEVTIVCELTDEGLFQLTLIDRAESFKVKPASDHTPDESIDVRKPGGCGITLIRTMTKSAVWRREDDCNILSMVFDKPSDLGASS